MFDIGFWEVMMIALIGIVVVGPEKLPEVMRGFFGFLRTLRRMYQDAKNDLSRELELDELEKSIRQGSDDFNNAFADITADGKELLRAIDGETRQIKEDWQEVVDEIEGKNKAVNKANTPDDSDNLANSPPQSETANPQEQNIPEESILANAAAQENSPRISFEEQDEKRN